MFAEKEQALSNIGVQNVPEHCSTEAGAPAANSVGSKGILSIDDLNAGSAPMATESDMFT
jgi:hypothetical protein